MKQLILGVLITLAVSIANALPGEARSLSLEEITLEQINLQGQVQTWRLHKVCIDEQAYLMLSKGLTEPISISASFKDGKPEPCHIEPSDRPGSK